MRLCWVLACGCALVFSGLAVRPARAQSEAVFRECCHRCRPVVACAPPPCPPVTTYYVARRCGPVRRLLGRCRILPAPSCRPCYAPPPIVVGVPVPAAPPCGPCAAPVPAFAPPPAALGPPASESYAPPAPQTPPPPVTGSSFRPLRPLTPIPPQPLTPPQSPPPVRLDRVVSGPGGPIEALPAVLPRPVPSR